MTEPSADTACCAALTDTALDVSGAAEPAAMFKALGDPVRLRLLSLITSAADEICVCDLTTGFELTDATISHHLKVLRKAGLIDGNRRGTWVYYRPVLENLRRLSALLSG